ncbi:MAG: 8-amino-7-oxononanoate synthase [Planctomycetaceae bacterium]
MNFTRSLAELEARGLRRTRRTVTPLPRGRCRVDGRECVNFSTNDYLDLAGDARLIAAAETVLKRDGCGARASALVSGRTEWHERLERRIAEFEGERAAILFPTGYAANLGTITALAGAEDVVFCERRNHASLIDGCRLSGAKFRVYRHDRLHALERELDKAAGCRRRWIVTDALFSMDGDLAPLRELCELADRFEAGAIVDEAHGTGVFGENGRGVCEHFGVERRVIRVGTLSKAVGCLGGFVAGSQELVDSLWNMARPQIFSTALPPAVCAAAAAAFDVIEQSPLRRERVRQLGERLRDRLRARGVAIPESCVAPIVPVIIGEPEPTVDLSRRLFERGFFVPAIRPPTVPHGTARLRISLSCAHDEEHVDALAAAIVKTHMTP